MERQRPENPVTNSKSVRSKRIVITGATGGIGSMLAQGLAANGHHLLCVGRNARQLDVIVEKIKNSGGWAAPFVADLRDEEQVTNATQKMIQDGSEIDGWINNVGANDLEAIGPTWTINPKRWWGEVSTNLYTAFLGTHAAIHCMKANRRGVVINLGGGGANVPKPYASAYGTSKTAVVRFTEVVNLELQEEGLPIKVFAFNPGFIKNRRTTKLVESIQAKTFMPKLVDVFQSGNMSKISSSIDLIEAILNGVADHLAGRYVMADVGIEGLLDFSTYAENSCCLRVSG
ncbi:MAG: SDR family oxidoreductase [Saprospiraceae bacterium]|nr:SDR family oxidoreductase [Saprospiraceae bacterium]